MPLSIIWAALRRRPLSCVASALLLVVFSSVLRVPVPLALLVWANATLLGLELWWAVEPVLLRHLGARAPDRLESTRLQAAVDSFRCKVLVVDRPEPWLYPSLRFIVVSRGMLDLVEDDGLLGLIAQAVHEQRLAAFVGEPLVWLANLGLVAAFTASRCTVRIGEALATVMGYSLILPALLFPRQFRRCVGWLLGAIIVGLSGASLITYGCPGIGLPLLVAWLLVPALDALLAWETRRTQACADKATVAAGLGWCLHEGLETVAWADELPRAQGPLGWLHRSGAPAARRLQQVERMLGPAPTV